MSGLGPDLSRERAESEQHSTYTDPTPDPDELAEYETEHRAAVERNRVAAYEAQEAARCSHDWLDRPESDSRECLICGEEVFGG